MKKLLIIISVMFYGCAATAQIKTLALNEGKYLKNSYKNDFVGKWKSENNNLKITIAMEKRHIKRNTIDVYVDALKINITHFVNNGIQISNKFTSEICLISVGDSDGFTGIYRDTISGNNVKISLSRVNSNELIFMANLPEIDFTNHMEKGTVFPNKVKLIRY